LTPPRADLLAPASPSGHPPLPSHVMPQHSRLPRLEDRPARSCRMTMRARLAAAFRSRRFLLCVFVGVAALASWVPRGTGPIDLRWDGGAYYILGTSLAEGDRYRLRSEPGGLPSSLHPPLVPALVALHQLALQTTDPVV